MDPRREQVLIQQLLSALGKPWVNDKVLTIVDGIPQWADAPGGGGGGGGGLGSAVKVQAYNSSQACAATSDTKLTFNTSIFDSTGTSMWDGAQHLIAPADGLYFFTGCVVFSDVFAPDGELSLYVRRFDAGGFGRQIYALHRTNQDSATTEELGVTISGSATLSAGDKLALVVENLGGSVDTAAGAGGPERVRNGGPVFSMFRAA